MSLLLVLACLAQDACPRPTCLFEERGIRPILDRLREPRGPEASGAWGLLLDHARAHGWRPLPGVSPLSPSCPADCLATIESAILALGSDDALYLEVGPLAELLARNGRGGEASQFLRRQEPLLPETGTCGWKTEALGTLGDAAFLEGDFEQALALYRAWSPGGDCGVYWNPLYERRLRCIETCLERLERWDELVAASREAALHSPIDGLCHAEVGLDACRRTGRDPGPFLEDLVSALEERPTERAWWNPAADRTKVEATLDFAQVEDDGPTPRERVARVVRHAEILVLAPKERLARLSELLDHGPAHVPAAAALLAENPAWIDRWLQHLDAASDWDDGEIGVLKALAATRTPCVRAWLDQRLATETRPRERLLLELADGERRRSNEP